MDYTILEKLMEQEQIEPKKIWKFFGLKTQEEMEEHIINNLKQIKIQPDDGYIYLAPDMIYTTSVENDHNVFYEKLMMISFFLRGFAGYQDTITLAFTKSIGMIRFIYLVDTTLKNHESYVFFKEAYLEFKKDRYFREQTSKMLQLFEEIGNQVEKIDLTETKQIIEDLKTIQEK